MFLPEVIAKLNRHTRVTVQWGCSPKAEDILNGCELDHILLWNCCTTTTWLLFSTWRLPLFNSSFLGTSELQRRGEKAVEGREGGEGGEKPSHTPAVLWLLARGGE